ncbi:MAG: 2-hydroxychromene-2-carboxylate isomerase [Burkholderiaceae bacterium]
MKVVDYYMTPVSPFTYLGHDRLRAICARHGAEIRLKLIDLGKVFPASGGLALQDRPPQRRAYRMLELKRWRDHLGLPLVPEPRHFPVPPHAAARAIIAVRETHGTASALDVAGDCLRAVWAEDKDISDKATVADILAKRGFDATALLAHAESADVEQRYAAETQEAIERGVFGAPSFICDGELYWGQDRLDFLDRALAR